MSVDFFTVPTIHLQVLYVFLVLAHDRRRILHFNITAHPTAEWTAQQLVQAFPWDSAPGYLLRDRDSIFGGEFVQQAKALGIQEVLSAPRSPWQRAFVERVTSRGGPTGWRSAPSLRTTRRLSYGIEVLVNDGDARTLGGSSDSLCNEVARIASRKARRRYSNRQLPDSSPDGVFGMDSRVRRFGRPS